MVVKLPREGASNSGSELPGSSGDGQIVLALRKMMKEEVEFMVISACEKLILPMLESLTRKVVKEEIKSALTTHGNRNHTHEATISTESRTLQLKFLDEVSLPVLTGKEIEGKGGTAMRLAIVDNMTGQLVNSGPEASAKVEILLLQADDDDDEHNWSTEDFNNKIIRESDKEKPHVAKGMYVRLEEGVGILSDVKLGHGSSWKKRCLCRLGARFVDDSNGSRVKRALTEKFMVEDRRGKLYGKHYPPSLLDEVWRLEKIGRDGGRSKGLYEEKIFTVRDFRFLLSIDPQRLQRIFKGSKVWKAIVDHAHTCIIDDKRVYLYSSPSKLDFVVAFDAVGQLMGIVRNSHYVHLDNLSEVEKASARELLLLAFANRDDITFVDDETSLVHQFPYESHDIGVAADSVCNDEYAPIEPDTSSPTIGPSMCPSNNISLIGSERRQQICDPSLPVPNQGPGSSPISPGSNRALGDPSLTFPHQGPSSSRIALGAYQASCDPSLAVPHQGPSSSLITLGSNQALCDPSLMDPYQDPSSSPIALGSNQALGDSSLTIPHHGPSSSLIPLGSNQGLYDPSLIVPYQGPSYSLIARGSCQALREPSLTVPDQGPIYSPNDLGMNQTLCYPSLTLPDQGPICPLNVLGWNQALCAPSFTATDPGSIYSLVTRGSYQASCDPFFIVRDPGLSSSLFALGPKHALYDSSLTLPDQEPSSAVIALGSYQASEQDSTDPFTDLNNLCEPFRGNELISLFYHHNNKHSKTYTKSPSVQQSNARGIRFFAAVGLRMWVSRVRKRVLGSCDFDVQKRQRIG